MSPPEKKQKTETTSSSRMITLKCSDGETFVVEEAVVVQSDTIRGMIEGPGAQDAVTLDGVTGNTLSKIIDYCRKHAQAAPNSDDTGGIGEDLEDWDENFVAVDPEMLHNLVMAADYLKISDLYDVTFTALWDSITIQTLVGPECTEWEWLDEEAADYLKISGLYDVTFTALWDSITMQTLVGPDCTGWEWADEGVKGRWKKGLS